MSTPKDYANPTARAELRRLHADAAKGEFSAEVRRQAVNALANALPALLDALDARDALLRRCRKTFSVQWHSQEGMVPLAPRDLIADMDAAGFTPEDT